MRFSDDTLHGGKLYIKIKQYHIALTWSNMHWSTEYEQWTMWQWHTHCESLWVTFKDHFIFRKTSPLHALQANSNILSCKIKHRPKAGLLRRQAWTGHCAMTPPRRTQPPPLEKKINVWGAPLKCEVFCALVVTVKTCVLRVTTIKRSSTFLEKNPAGANDCC